MMIGRKGQGALEYLLILAGVLAIAVVVLLVAHQVAAPAQQSSKVKVDQFNCAQAGIELLNYNSLPAKGDTIKVNYEGHDATCSSGTMTDATATCKITDSDGGSHTLAVKLSGDTVTCEISDW